MRGRRLSILLLSTSLLAVGCQPKPESEWVEQSPFRNREGQPDKAEVLIVTCDFYPLELPGHINLSNLSTLPPLLSDPAATSSPLPPTTQTAATTFRRQYRRNGMFVGVAPVADWSAMREQIIQAGGVGLGRVTQLLRRPSDVAECVTNELSKPVTLFAQQETGPRGYTVGPGACAFHVSIQPAAKDPATSAMQLHLVPVIRPHELAPQSRPRLHAEANGTPAAQMITFAELAATLEVPPDGFILIAYAPAEPAVSNVGKVFLHHDNDGSYVQRVLIVVPAIRTAQQVRRTFQSGQAPRRD